MQDMTVVPDRVFAPAKVNLFLHVGPAREDGRHPLDSLVVFADENGADHLIFSAADHFRLDVTGVGAEAAGPLADNLVLRAVRALVAEVPSLPRYAITLDKRLPVAAGLGGGSSDAGAVLRTLGAVAGLGAPALMDMAAQLGGDVPACVLSRACRMQDDGAQVHPIAGLPELPALLVNPMIACPTGPVFAAFDKLDLGRRALGALDCPIPTDWTETTELIDWLSAATSNDLEGPACASIPEIGTVLETLRALPAARLVRMSGSGASCFALFETTVAAKAARDELERLAPHWWARVTQLR